MSERDRAIDEVRRLIAREPALAEPFSPEHSCNRRAAETYGGSVAEQVEARIAGLLDDAGRMPGASTAEQARDRLLQLHADHRRLDAHLDKIEALHHGGDDAVLAAFPTQLLELLYFIVNFDTSLAHVGRLYHEAESDLEHAWQSLKRRTTLGGHPGPAHDLVFQYAIARKRELLDAFMPHVGREPEPSPWPPRLEVIHPEDEAFSPIDASTLTRFSGLLLMPGVRRGVVASPEERAEIRDVLAQLDLGVARSDPQAKSNVDPRFKVEAAGVKDLIEFAEEHRLVIPSERTIGTIMGEMLGRTLGSHGKWTFGDLAYVRYGFSATGKPLRDSYPKLKEVIDAFLEERKFSDQNIDAWKEAVLARSVAANAD